MRASVLVLFVVALASPARADIGPVWTRWYDGPPSLADSGVAIAIDNDGNVVVAGTSVGDGSSGDFVVIKYTPDGHESWTRRLDAFGRDDEVAGLGLDRAGNIIVAGRAARGGPFNIDYLTVKYSPAGETLWTRTHNGIGGRADVAHAMSVDDSGCACVTGQSDRNSSGGTRYEIATVKYLPNGDTAWARTYGPGGSMPMASGHGAGMDRAGCVYVTGDAGTLDDGIFDFVTIKYAPGGETLWTRVYDSPGHGDDYPHALAVDRWGSVVVTGRGGNDIATVKYDSSGTELWSALYDAGGADEAYALALDGAGAVYVAGKAGGFFSVVKYSATGIREWAVTQPGTRAYDVAVDDSANVYVCGWGTDGYLTAKYDSAGAEMWSIGYEGSNSTSARALAVDGEGDVYVTGVHWGSSWSDILSIKYSEDVGVEEHSKSRALRAGRGPGPGDADCRVLDITGRDVTERKSLLSPGVYFLRRDADASTTRKVVIQR